MGKQHTIHATVVLPVHVGGGDEHLLDPLGYALKKDSVGKIWLYRIDTAAMFFVVKGFSREFVKHTENKNTIMSLRSLIAESFDPQKKETWIYRCAVSKKFLENYNQNFNNMNNQLLIQCFPLCNRKPYIPGSSIKGAIRTAILDQLAERKGYAAVKSEVETALQGIHDAHKKRAKMIERNILQYTDIKTDPFKGIKVSDAFLPQDCTEIVKIFNVSKDNAKITPFNLFVEVLKPKTEFSFTITIEERAGMTGIDLVKKNVTFENIMSDCYHYYTRALEDEADAHYKQESKADNYIQDALCAVMDENNHRIPNRSILRLGRFTHLESKSYNDRGINGLCKPKPPNDSRTKRPRPWGTTRNLVDGKKPLGVIVLEY